MPSRFRSTVVAALTVPLLSLGFVTGHATTVEKMNVAKLIEYSELILVGEVIGVTDGFDGNNLPYTEVSLQVSEALKGVVGGSYTFRQFGLLAPRDMGNGRTYVGVSPDGWPRFQVGENIIVFLYAKTSLGFQSSTGLLQGKFNISDNRVANAINNVGLFENINVQSELLSNAEEKMIGTARGECPVETFRGFVRKAVDQDLFNAAQPRTPKRGDQREEQ
jgi:hypothetical protein